MLLSSHLETGDLRGLSVVLSEIGMNRTNMGDHSTARSTILRTLGLAQIGDGMLDAAETSLTDALAIARDIGAQQSGLVAP